MAAGLLLLPVMALAAPELYGNINLSVNRIARLNNNEVQMSSHYSYFGLRGSQELENNITLSYKYELEVDPTERGANNSGNVQQENAVIRDRDQWLGLTHPDYGSVRFGTISTSYKSSAAAIDPMFQTFFEARGFLGVQSRLQSDDGPYLGRSANTVRYDSLAYDGVRLTANYALAEQQGNVYGGGLSYESGRYKLFTDFIKSNAVSAMVAKLSGQVDLANGVRVAGQYETGDDALLDPSASPTMNTIGVKSALMLNLSYHLEDNMISFTAGKLAAYNTGYGLAIDRRLGKTTSVYAGIALKSYEQAVGLRNDKAMALGFRHTF